MNYYSPGGFTLLLTMKSARIIRTNEPLLVEGVAVPRPKYDQVLVRVQSAGVCHSDLHLWEGGYVGPGGSFMKVEDRGVRFPLTPGHVVAGTIEDVGESVTGYQRGEKVLVYPWIGEGLCPACRVGEEHLCTDLVELVALAKTGKIQSVVSKRFTLDQANQSLGDLKSGKIIGRAVLNLAN